MKEQDNFIKNLSALLEEEGITQRELAEKIGVTEVTISRYLSGERNPRIEIVSKIANFFNVTVDYLLGINREYGATTPPEKHQEKQIEKHNANLQNKKAEDERLVAFYEGYNDLDEADKDVLMATFDAFIKARKGE
jgi:transcriptional regulator with XRE-family HTH domain